MEAVLPNLLVRTVSDPVDSHLSPREPSPDPDHSGVSFRPKSSPAAAAVSPTAAAASPRSLHLEVKDRRDPALFNGRPRPVALREWAEAPDLALDEELERSRVLSLGIWTDDAIGKEGSDFLGQPGAGGCGRVEGANPAAAATGVAN